MEENKLQLSIVTPYGDIFDGYIKHVSLPGADGEFGVLLDHCDMLSLLKTGVIEFTRDDDIKELVAINWGYAEVSSNKVDILVNGAVAIRGDSDIYNSIENAKNLLKEASSDMVAISATITKIETSAKQLLK